jgi:hypothetical protein
VGKSKVAILLNRRLPTAEKTVKTTRKKIDAAILKITIQLEEL